MNIQKNLVPVYPCYWILGMRIDPDSEEPDFYVIMGQNDSAFNPLLFENQLIMFRQKQQSASALQLAGVSLLSPEHLEAESFWLDFAQAFYLLALETYDDSATILNLINVLSDILPALGMTPPDEYQKVLDRLAHHLTYEKEFGDFIDQELVTRTKSRDGLVWCLGALFASCKIL